MFAKPKIVIGVDLGTHSVKAVQLSKFGNSARVEKALLLRLGSDTSEEKRMEDTVHALRSVASTLDVKKGLIVTALAGQDTFIRYLRFPKMPPEELKSSAELEADQNLPYDLSEVSMDSVVLEEITERGETIMKVLLVAARKEVISQTIDLFRSVGLMPSILGGTTLALSDAFEINAGFRPDETVALINIGASATNIHFCRDGISNFTRDISRGGKDLTSAIQKLLKVDFAEAERMKVSYGQSQFGSDTDNMLENIDVNSAGDEIENLALQDHASEGGGADVKTEPMAQVNTDDISRVVNATRPALSRLIGEIRRSIDYYEKQLYEKNVDRLVLSGGTAMFPGLDQSLADATGVPVEIVNPVQSLMVQEDSPDVRDLMENRAQFNVVVGLAARGIEEL
ncbi:MAG: type IV pilus assembly protein PilM [Candidatus Hydrogenedentota bacterium]|nr:MAG: type IV pilus assembly protein PilM [Candidatus Hydrogenedentota bacterium]